MISNSQWGNKKKMTCHGHVWSALFSYIWGPFTNMDQLKSQHRKVIIYKMRDEIAYLCWDRLKLNHVSKRDPWLSIHPCKRPNAYLFFIYVFPVATAADHRCNFLIWTILTIKIKRYFYNAYIIFLQQPRFHKIQHLQATDILPLSSCGDINRVDRKSMAVVMDTCVTPSHSTYKVEARDPIINLPFR